MLSRAGCLPETSETLAKRPTRITLERTFRTPGAVEYPPGQPELGPADLTFRMSDCLDDACSTHTDERHGNGQTDDSENGRASIYGVQR